MKRPLFALGATIALVVGVAHFTGEAVGDDAAGIPFEDGRHQFCADGAPLNVDTLTYADGWIASHGAVNPEEAVADHLEGLREQRERAAAALDGAAREAYLEATAPMADLAPSEVAVEAADETYLDLSREEGWLAARFVVAEQGGRHAVHETFVCDSELVGDAEALQELFGGG